MYYLSTLFW